MRIRHVFSVSALRFVAHSFPHSRTSIMTPFRHATQSLMLRPNWITLARRRDLQIPFRSISTYHFDTFKFVERLEAEGFSREQSEAIMASLREVISESMTDATKGMVTKAEQEKTVYTYKVDFAHLKSEIQLLEKNDFTMMKAENERLMGEVEKLRQKLREEITRSQANVRLDLHLEKGRIRDEASAQEIKIKETDTRIESEIAGLRTQMEAIKFQILQYMIGTITGAGALFLAYLRMLR